MRVSKTVEESVHVLIWGTIRSCSSRNLRKPQQISPDGNLNAGPPDYEIGTLSIPPRCSLFKSCTSWNRHAAYFFGEAYTIQILNLIFFLICWVLRLFARILLSRAWSIFPNFHGNERWSVSAASLVFLSFFHSLRLYTTVQTRNSRHSVSVRYSLRICKKK
jgi:hypothetical protein